MTGVRKQRTEVAHPSIGSIIRGVTAGGLGTLAMDASLYRGYRHDGGNAHFPGWESSDSGGPERAPRLRNRYRGRVLSP